MLNIGQTTFFGLMVSVIVPPSMPLAIYCYALLTMGIGMLLGWAWGVAAWAAAYSVRDKALLQRRMEAAIAQMDGSETQTAMSSFIN